jgi:hypothetical protein
VDRATRRHWLNTYRLRARATRADLRGLEVPLNDPVAAQIERRLQTVIEIYEAGIADLEKADEADNG